MAADPHQVIGNELDPGERLLWSGQPRRGIVFRGTDVFMIPFSLLWGGFAIFWEAAVLWGGHHGQGKVPFFFALWGVPFILIGLYLIFGRFLVDAAQRENTYYGLTDRRAIIVFGLFGSQPRGLAILIYMLAGVAWRRTKAIDLRTLTDIEMTESSDGSGTINLGPRPANYWWHTGEMPGLGHKLMYPNFEFIPNVKQVFNQLRAARGSSY